MRFEESIEIDAAPQRVWDVLSDIEAWPERVETVDVGELLTPDPVAKGSRIRLKQPKLPEGTWDITVWDPPSYFEMSQKSGGVTNVAGPPGRGAGGRQGASDTQRGDAGLDRPGRRPPLQGHDHPLPGE